MTKFEPDLFECKPESICKENNWWWIKEDLNAWDGPSKNWEQSHHIKYYSYLRPEKNVVVTAGANHGIHCRFYAQTFKHVYAFEPNPYSFHCLSMNCPYDNVYKMNCALGSRCEMVDLSGKLDKQSGLVKIKPGGFVPCITIDVLNLSACDLIQLDVEGYESKILRGALKTIEKYRPVVIAENGRRGDVRDFMEKMNYECKEQSVSDTIWIPK